MITGYEILEQENYVEITTEMIEAYNMNILINEWNNIN